MPKHFIPRNESFICAHCGQSVTKSGMGTGTSYRNHCPFCLWSRHVDSDIPGDRNANCNGLMEPISVSTRRTGEYVLRHRCLKCGVEKLNRIAGDDDFDLITKLS